MLTVNNAAPTATLSGVPSTIIVGQTITPSLSSPLDPSSPDVAAGLRYMMTIDVAPARLQLRDEQYNRLGKLHDDDRGSSHDLRADH